MFKIGDQVRIKDNAEYWVKNCFTEGKVHIVTSIDGRFIGLNGNVSKWSSDRFKLVPEEKPVETNIISMDKKYTTRDGHAVRILCVDAKSPWPIIGLVTSNNNEEFKLSWTDSGHLVNDGTQTDHDLIEVKEKFIRWGIVYAKKNERFMSGQLYETKDEAERVFNDSTNQSKFLVVPVEWEE